MVNAKGIIANVVKKLRIFFTGLTLYLYIIFSIEFYRTVAFWMVLFTLFTQQT